MARKVFFSFHYQRDYWRVNQVRNSWLTQGRANSFIDSADWEKVQRRGDKAIKEWIDRQLHGTSVTVVLIGKETHERKFVNYEIEQSHKKGNGIIGVRIHGLKDQNGDSAIFPGRNPFKNFITDNDLIIPSTCADVYPVYPRISGDGYENLHHWVENAAKMAASGRKFTLETYLWSKIEQDYIDVLAEVSNKT